MMLERVGEPALYEQLAEEASELSQAALKVVRVIRGENPTPLTKEEAIKNLIEEYTDVQTCAHELHLYEDAHVAFLKYKRFIDRWEEFEGGEN